MRGFILDVVLVAGVVVAFLILALAGCGETDPGQVVGGLDVKQMVREARGEEPRGEGPVIWQVCYEDCGPLICVDCFRGFCERPPDGCLELREWAKEHVR